MDDLADVSEAIRLRGLFVYRYSGVEWAVSALILHAQQHDAYSEYKGLPWPWSGKRGGKLERLRDLVDHGGPLDPYVDRIRAYLQSFAELDERRNFMVHAIMTPRENAAGETTFKFAMFRPTKEGTDYGTMVATITELEALADAVQPISSGFTGLAASIVRDLNVSPIVAMFDMEAPPPFNLKLGNRI